MRTENEILNEIVSAIERDDQEAIWAGVVEYAALPKTKLDKYVEAVMAALDFEEVLARYGSKCPKCGKQPVLSKVGFWYCLNCATGGDAFKYITLAEGINYVEAIEREGDRLGIERPSKQDSSNE